MDIYIYADESGVFDPVHNDLFTYGGVIYLSKNERDNAARKYLNVERSIYDALGYDWRTELKACILKGKHKRDIFRSMNNTIKFGVVIDLEKILPNILESKKHKQRYLDYAFKIGLKKCFQRMISIGKIDPSTVRNVTVYFDEHTTATSGIYELREGLEEEFKNGTYNHNYGAYYEPIFSNMENVNLMYCNSSKKTLIRAADIVANRVYHDTLFGKLDALERKMHIHYEPTQIRRYINVSCYGSRIITFNNSKSYT